MPLELRQDQVIHHPPAVTCHTIPVPHRRRLDAAWNQIMAALEPAQRQDLESALETVRQVLRV